MNVDHHIIFICQCLILNEVMLKQTSLLESSCLSIVAESLSHSGPSTINVSL